MEQHRCIQSTLEAGLARRVASHSQLTPQRLRLIPPLISSTFCCSKLLTTQSGPSRMNRHHACPAQGSRLEKAERNDNERNNRVTETNDSLAGDFGSEPRRVCGVVLAHGGSPGEARTRPSHSIPIPFPVPFLFRSPFRFSLLVREGEGAFFCFSFLSNPEQRYITCLSSV